MRWMIAALALFVQATPLPPAYPRPGTTKLLENNRVLVWDISWLKQQYPLHRHPYDLTGVYYTDGDRTIVSESGQPQGRLICESATAVESDGQPYILLTLTARGVPDPPTKEAALEFLGRGRNLIVNAFAEITTDSAHEKWERVR